jgi:tetratricopeptide (TPR) repeat protein
MIPSTCLAQKLIDSDEENAAVYLDEYSDDFQEKFFEGLKQKGIENYDKAINLFLDCKNLDPNAKAIDHELARVYGETKQFDLAQEYAIKAVNNDPENYWYLQNLVTILHLKHDGIATVTAEIPYENTVLKQNLVLVFYAMQNYDSAIQILNTLKASNFTEHLNSKIKTGLKIQEENTETYSFSTPVNSESRTTESGSIAHYKNYISNLIRSENYTILDTISKEALENYPAQPYFYYTRGLALNSKKRYREAITILEEALDYMLDDISLSNKINKELSVAYNGINNSAKANMYLRKIKPGF